MAGSKSTTYNRFKSYRLKHPKKKPSEVAKALGIGYLQACAWDGRLAREADYPDHYDK